MKETSTNYLQKVADILIRPGLIPVETISGFFIGIFPAYADLKKDQVSPSEYWNQTPSAATSNLLLLPMQ